MGARRQERAEERRGQIIRGALEVFAAKGFVQSTNRDIAAAAGINSAGLIYHYFENKEDLLRAVIQQYAPPLQVIARPDEFERLPLREALTRFGMAYLRLMDDPQAGACFRMVLGEALRSEEFAHRFGGMAPLPVLGFLADYLSRRMEEGMLRRVDPMAAVKCFLGPLLLQVLVVKVMRFTDEASPDSEKLMAACVDIFLQGLLPAR